MKFRSLFIILTISCTSLNVFAEGSCSIDGQQSPELAKYEYETNTLIGKLKQQSSSCGGNRSNGLVSNTKRTLEVLDKAKAEIPTMGNITLDFNYNIQMAFKGESRAGVIENGKVFQRVEQMLISTLDTLANTCNLDGINEDIVVRRIQLNYSLETLYKSTALGLPGNAPGDIPDEYQGLAAEIQKTYNPTATQGCKNQYSFEKMSEDIMNKIGSIGGGIEKGLTDWKYAIALIRGGKAIGEEKYTALKKSLLTQELQRQGFSAGVIDQMVKNLSCVEDATKGDSNPIDVALAKGKCMSIGFIGVAQDRFMKEWNKMLLGANGAKTTTSYINRVSTYESIKTNNLNTVKMHKELEALFTENIGTDDEMVTKLIALHVNLLSISDQVEKRIPPMLENCRKIQPGVSCNF